MSRYRDISDDQEAEIQRQIALDPDAPEATDEELALAQPFADAFPDLMENIQLSARRSLGKRPHPPISIRLDADVAEKFKAMGKGLESKINEILRNAEI